MYGELVKYALIYSPLVVIIYAVLSCFSPMWQRLCGVVCINSGVTLLAYHLMLNGYLSPNVIAYFAGLLYISCSLIVSFCCYKGHLIPAKAPSETKVAIYKSSLAISILFLIIGLIILINHVSMTIFGRPSTSFISQYMIPYIAVSLLTFAQLLFIKGQPDGLARLGNFINSITSYRESSAVHIESVSANEGRKK